MLPSTQLDLDDLRVVHAVVHHRGATRAAAQLALSQSAVSHRLRLIEERLGGELFERRGKRLEPLPAALRLADTAEQLIAPLAEVEAELRHAPALPPLRLAVQCYTGYEWLPPVLAALTSQYPQLTVEIVVEATCNPMDALVAGRIDLALCSVIPQRPRFVIEPLFADELVAVLPANHALAKRQWIAGSAIADESLFVFEVGTGLREHLKQRVFPEGGGFRHVHRVPVTEAIVALVRSGAGVSILPRWSIAQAVERGDVVGVRLTRRGLRRDWSAVYSARSPLRAQLVALVDQTRSVGGSGLLA